MSIAKFVTRKMIPFHGDDEEFTNVYFFGDGTLGNSPTESESLAVLDALIASEKTIFTANVRFLGAVAYHIGAADTPGDTDAIAIRELAATGHQGTMGTSDGIYRECAIDLKFLLGGRRYLRSLLHTDHSHGTDPTGNTATSVSGLSAAIKAFAEKQLNGPWPGTFQRRAPNGDRPTAIMYNPYLEHRQFHRYRKRPAGLLGQVGDISGETLLGTLNAIFNGGALFLLTKTLERLEALLRLAREVQTIERGK